MKTVGSCLVLTLVSAEFHIEQEKLGQFHSGLDNIFRQLEESLHNPVQESGWVSSKLSVDPLESFSFPVRSQDTQHPLVISPEYLLSLIHI